MRIKKIFLLTGFLFVLLTGWTQPPNDLCQNAANFPPLTIGVQTCMAATNAQANPEFPYSYQSNCKPAGTQGNPALDVWFTVTIPANANTLDVLITGNISMPNFSLYTGICGGLVGAGCAIGGATNLAATFAPVSQNTTYYIQVSGFDTIQQGQFNLCLTPSNDTTLCVVQTNLVVNPPPTGGVYSPGDTVEFCYTVSQFDQKGNNWFHGLTIHFGNGWDTTGMKTVAANSCDNVGFWAWYNSVTSTQNPQPNGGFTTGPGFFYDSPKGPGNPGLDSIPGNNQGDQTSGNCAWTFCWTVVVRSDSCPAKFDLGLRIEHWGDGETGGYFSLACNNDPDYIFSAQRHCCLLPILSVQQPSCAGQCDGAASVVGQGTPPFTYLWSTGATGTSISNLCPGVYNVTVSDNDSCSQAMTFVLTNQSPAVIASISAASDPNCAGGNDGSATASVNGGTSPFSYSWSPIGGTAATGSGLSAGNYTVYITDSAGCLDTASVTLSEPLPLQLQTSGTGISCFGLTDGTASVAVSGGTGPYSYLWANGGLGTATTGLGFGFHQVVVTDAKGCQDSAQFFVNQPNPLSITVSGNNETCVGWNNGSVTAFVAGGTFPYNYIWSPSAATTANVQNLSAGTYTVTVTDANNCLISDAVSITANPKPTANAGLDISFCEGDGGDSLHGSASGQFGPFYYTWTCNIPNCGLSCIFCSDPVANPTVTSTYYLVVTDANGCTSDVDSVLVTVLPKPTVNAGPDKHICEQPAPGKILNASVSGAPGPFIYLWKPSAGLNDPSILNPFARPDTTTIYTLIATSSNGCSSDFTTVDTNSSVTVTVNPRPTANAGSDTSICFGDSIKLNGVGYDAGPNYNYQWSPSTGLSNPMIPSPIAFPQLQTEYILVVWSLGCASIGDTMTINVMTIPTNDAGPNRDICFGDSMQLGGSAGGVLGNPSFNFSWSPSDSMINSNTFNPVVFPNLTTMFYMVAVSDEGCKSNIDSVEITVNPTPIAEAGPNLVYCLSGDSLKLQGSVGWENGIQPSTPWSVFIEWTPKNDLSSAYIFDPYVFPPTSQWYYLTTEHLTCTSHDSVLVSVFPEIVAMVSSDTNVICEGESVQLYGTGGTSGARYDWTSGKSLDDSTSREPLATPSASTTYVLRVDEAGCYDYDSIQIEVLPTPTVAFLGSQMHGCVPLDINFLQTSTDAEFFIWSFGDDSPISNAENPTHTFNSPGLFEIKLTAIGKGACADSLTGINVLVIDTASADFSSLPADPVVLYLPESEVQFLDNSENALGWIWDFGDGNSSNDQSPKHLYTEPGSYFVKLFVLNEEGCVSEMSRGPYVVKAPDLQIPNIFSPNGDGNNDEFLVNYAGSQPYYLAIRDRWGNGMFATQNKLQGWDGRNPNNGTDMAEGVYFYTLRIGSKEFTGHLTLMR